MLTDDPGTPGDRKWEINIADVGQYQSSQWVSQFPYLDVNYGVGEHIQLKYETPINSVANTGMPVGGSQGTLGTKIRFIDEKDRGLDCAIYPQYQFTPSYINGAPTAGTSAAFLPLLLTKKIDDFILNPEVGYTFSYGGSPNYWTLGLLLAREYSEKYEVMAEIFGQYGGGGQQETLMNVGGRWNLNETLTLQGSVGCSLGMPSGAAAMQFSYMGMQLHL